MFLGTVAAAQAQASKTVNEVEQAWLGLFNQTRISKHWGIWFDVHQRQTDHFFNRPSQTFLRPAAIYYLNDNTRLMAGYAFVWFYKAPQDQAGHQEHRPWQQIWWRQTHAWFNSTQWVRLEERFVEKVKNGAPQQDYGFNWRVRYSYTLAIPLNHKKTVPNTWSLSFQDELFINFGHQITYNYFDQNRLFGGIGYQFSEQCSATFGYMNVFLQTAAGNVFQSADCLRLYVYYNLDFRKKE